MRLRGRGCVTRSRGSEVATSLRHSLNLVARGLYVEERNP